MRSYPRKCILFLIYTLTAVISTGLFGCSGGGDSDSACINIAGSWSVTENVTDCDGEQSTSADTYVVSQNGCSVKMMTKDGTFDGQVDGNTVSWNASYNSDDGGVVSYSAQNIKISGENVNGSVPWTWSGYGSSCNGTTIISGTLIQAAGSDTNTDVSGTWNGSWNSSGYGVSGTFSTEIIQNGTVLSGIISVSGIGLEGAPLKGNVNGRNFTFGDINDQITFVGTITGSSMAGGSYNYPGLSDKGSWQGTKTGNGSNTDSDNGTDNNNDDDAVDNPNDDSPVIQCFRCLLAFGNVGN